MITRINYHRAIDILEAVKRIQDKYEDFYITRNKQRLFLNNLEFIEKILKTQECYVWEEKEIKGILLIYREKNFRPYIKLLSESNKYYRSLLKFLNWNFAEKEFYCKVKKINFLSEICKKNGFMFIGNRGQEILLVKKAIKDLHKIVPKDMIGEKHGNNYNKNS